MTTHKLARMQLMIQRNNLSQALSSDKRPVSFLIGAGCPQAIRDDDNKPLIPGIAGLTQFVIKVVSTDNATSTSLDVVLTALSEKLESFKRTIEDVLGYVRELKSVIREGEFKGLNKTLLRAA